MNWTESIGAVGYYAENSIPHQNHFIGTMHNNALVIMPQKRIEIPQEGLEELYWNEGMSLYEIGKMFGCSWATIRNRMTEYGISCRTHSQSVPTSLGLDVSKDELYDLYWNQKLSLSQIGGMWHCDTVNVLWWMKKHGIPRRTASESGRVTDVSKDELNDLYWNQGLSTIAIGKKLGCSGCVIRDRMVEYGIHRRTRTENRVGKRNPMHGRTGEKNPAWNGGTSFKPYCHKFNKPLKEAIRERDNRTCQKCNAEENGRKLDVHHIHYDKENCDPDLISLCRRCNVIVNSNRKYWEAYFMANLAWRGLLREEVV